MCVLMCLRVYCAAALGERNAGSRRIEPSDLTQSNRVQSSPVRSKTLTRREALVGDVEEGQVALALAELGDLRPLLARRVDAGGVVRAAWTVLLVVVLQWWRWWFGWWWFRWWWEAGGSRASAACCSGAQRGEETTAGAGGAASSLRSSAASSPCRRAAPRSPATRTVQQHDAAVGRRLEVLHHALEVEADRLGVKVAVARPLDALVAEDVHVVALVDYVRMIANECVDRVDCVDCVNCDVVVAGWLGWVAVVAVWPENRLAQLRQEKGQCGRKQPGSSDNAQKRKAAGPLD